MRYYILFVTSAAIALVLLYSVLSFPERRRKRPGGNAMSPVLLVLAIALVGIAVLTLDGYMRTERLKDMSLTDEEIGTLSYDDATRVLRSTMEAGDVPLNANGRADLPALKGRILIFFRPNCGDCEAIHDELSALAADHPDILFVNTRSEVGKDLAETYQIKNVPSAVYVTVDQPLSYYRFPLYKDVLVSTDPDGTMHWEQEYDGEVMGQILGYQAQGW